MPGSSSRRSGRQSRQGRAGGRSRPAPGGEGRSRFTVDAMLGSLARKLRALGFDAAYYKSGDDTELMELSRREGRIILTADRSLAARADAKGIRALLVTGNSDGKRIGALARGAAARGFILTRGDPLCSICGGPLRVVARDEISEKVPPSVRRRHRLFFRCSSCGQMYWRGSHWKKLISLARRLKQS